MLLDEISARLDDADIAPVFAAGFPSTESGTLDDAIAVFEYAGASPLHVKDQTEAVSESPRFQVICRSKRYLTARVMAGRVFAILDGFRGNLDGVRYHGIRALQSPFFLDRDDAGRTRIVTNYEADKELSEVI